MKIHFKTIFQKELCGSYTLESTIIVPLLFFMLFQFVLLAFTMHDTVSAKNVSYRYLIDYAMGKPNNLNLQNTYNNESITKNNASFSCRFTETHLSISSDMYTLPVTFSNYNNAEQLRKYLALKQ